MLGSSHAALDKEETSCVHAISSRTGAALVGVDESLHAHAGLEWMRKGDQFLV